MKCEKRVFIHHGDVAGAQNILYIDVGSHCWPEESLRPRWSGW
ncbi:MAG: hypothetical protein QW740_03270 [Sulfolobales archaeon]